MVKPWPFHACSQYVLCIPTIPLPSVVFAALLLMLYTPPDALPLLQAPLFHFQVFKNFTIIFVCARVCASALHTSRDIPYMCGNPRTLGNQFSPFDMSSGH